MRTVTKQVTVAVEVIAAVAEAIRDLGEVPAGHLYASLCGLLSLNEFNQIIALLKEKGLILESNHLLTASSKSLIATDDDDYDYPRPMGAPKLP